VKFLGSKRGIVTLLALLLVLFLFRPGVHPLRHRIAASIGSALGRRVTIDNVRVHLLPRPGFDLGGLIIADNPEFSSEPFVRAQDVSAAIRLRPLLRGRLEIATLSATEPSINLVRNAEGRWNLATLLERSAQIPAAPTNNQASGGRPAFPYLEASHARINLKIGQEKKAWALTDAEVALWQESENSWGARAAAQPTRIDVNLTDTGLVQANATWQRASSSSDTPLQVTVLWKNGQLGQITKLFTGRDHGWRGDVRLTATLSGTPRALQVQSQLRIDNFRRYDIMNNASLRLSTDCSAQYNSVLGMLGNLECDAVAGNGAMRLTGNAGPVGANLPYDLTLMMQHVPLPSAVLLVRQSKKGLPDDLAASGRIDAEFHARRTNAADLQWNGKGGIYDVRLSPGAGKEQILFGDIPLVLASGDAGKARAGQHLRKTNNNEPAGIHLNIGPFPLALGAGTRAIAGGVLTKSDYWLFLRGETEITSLYRLADAIGVPGFRPVAEGGAKVDLSMSGSWQGFQAPVTLGTAQLHNVHTGMRGLNPGIGIAAGSLRLDPDSVSLDRLSAEIGDTHWAGAVRAPRHCAQQDCIFWFDLAADQLSSAGLAEWFASHPIKRPWYRILAPADKPSESPLLGIRAQGRMRVDWLNLAKVDATQVSAQVELDHGRVTLRDLTTQLFQGSHQGTWVIEAAARPMQYQVTGNLQNVSLNELGTAMNDPWITGTADAKFELSATGLTFPELLAHADGQLKLAMENGTFTHLGIPETGKPFPVHVFAARIQVKDGVWNMNAGRIESHDGIYQISGTASPAGGLNLLLMRGDEQLWNITGTLLKPRPTRAGHTEARTLIKP